MPLLSRALSSPCEAAARSGGVYVCVCACVQACTCDRTLLVSLGDLCPGPPGACPLGPHDRLHPPGVWLRGAVRGGGRGSPWRGARGGESGPRGGSMQACVTPTPMTVALTEAGGPAEALEPCFPGPEAQQGGMGPRVMAATGWGCRQAWQGPGGLGAVALSVASVSTTVWKVSSCPLPASPAALLPTSGPHGPLPAQCGRHPGGGLGHQTGASGVCFGRSACPEQLAGGPGGTRPHEATSAAGFPLGGSPGLQGLPRPPSTVLYLLFLFNSSQGPWDMCPWHSVMLFYVSQC